MKKLFKSEQKISKYYRTDASKYVVEKQIIMDFFAKMPIESLKKLINFQEIDFENKELWNDYNKQEMLSQLRDENVVQYTCELYIESES
jgi:hypothetical protein